MNPDEKTPQPSTDTNPEATPFSSRVNDIAPLNDIQKPDTPINSPTANPSSIYPQNSEGNAATIQPAVNDDILAPQPESSPSVPQQVSQSPFQAPIASGPSDPSSTFQPDDAPKKSKKPLIIVSIVALLVVLLGSGMGAYALWYTNPEKVLLDAVTNSIKANTAVTEGDFVVKDSDNNGTVTVKFSSESDTSKYAGMLEAEAKIEYEGFDTTIAGAGMVAESGDIYLRVDNAKQLLDKALETEYGKLYTSEPSLQSPLQKFKAFVAKIDGKWIKIDKSQIEESIPDYDKQQACYKKAFDTFYQDSAQQQQVIKAYQDNKFITIADTGKSQTINGKDSVAYDMSFDVAEAEAFGKALEKTDLVKAVEKCGDSSDVASSDDIASEVSETSQKDIDKTTVTVWISRWGHEFTKVETAYKDESASSTFDMTIDHAKQPSLKDPSGALDAKELIKEIEVIYAELAAISPATTMPVEDNAI